MNGAGAVRDDGGKDTMALWSGKHHSQATAQQESNPESKVCTLNLFYDICKFNLKDL